MELEADPKDTASLKHLAQACEKHLQKLSQDEEAQEDIVKAREGYWASRQFAEFNLWCAKVGVNGEGLRSIDVRLKDVPEICELLSHLLQSLERDLNELQQPAEVPTQISNADNNPDDVESDASSLSFKSLPSSEGSKGQSATGDVASPWRKRNLALRRHIGDTIDRLHIHARRIERAGVKHRRERVEVYREKEDSKWAYEGFKKLAAWKANEEFKLASDTIRPRIAESFARRRIRFEYLKEHQKKRAVDTGMQEQDSPPEPQLKGGDGLTPVVRKQEAPKRANVPVRRRLQDQHTIYSATENTKLDLRPEPRRQERAESVASVALRHPGFPPPPKTSGGSFQCPYCRLEFRAREAERDRWSQHVMQDFEPYFCTFEGCKAPFDVPNTFDGLLGHLQDHLPIRYHVDMPDGEHKEFDETEFEEHVKRYGEISEEMLATMKEASRRKGAFLFESCPFCGGYPDVLEKRLPDPNTPEAQTELRKHIKQHMQDIALFLPPYREDIFNEDDDLKSSAVTRRSVNQNNSGEPDECKTVCDRQDCDCNDKGKYAAEDALAAESIAETKLSTLAPDPEAEEEDADSWPELFGDSPLYDRSSVSDDYYLRNERLQPFIARLEPVPSSDQRTRSPVPGHNADYTIGWICAISTEYIAAQGFLDQEHDRSEYVSPNDNNDYTLGKVGKHNVVIAVLPDGEYGISSAASVARDMLHSFPNVRIGLMVGIGGGAPSRKHDIRLGDIVVSAPRDGKGGVFQYDFGKTIQDQSFRPTGFLNQPPALLRAAVSGLKAQYERKGHQLEEAINSILEGNRRLRQKYKRPDRSSDRLYQPGVVHPPEDEAGCATVCGDDPSRLILRPKRTEDEDNPAVHYGLIASANQLMKDATVRDRLAAEKDVLCFEMEAAGLMNHFPCLVIRGICDYSDSHKNKEWQGYAAMAAAAYAKDLLYRIAPNMVEAERKITEILSSVKRDVNEMRAKVQDASNPVKHLGFEQKREKIDRWLLPPDPSINYNKALGQRYEGSGHWFLASGAFTKWKTRRNSFLWLYGIPGCGKTILSSTIIKNLNSIPSSQPLLYFYFDFNNIGKQTLESMIRALISQLYYKHIEASQQLDTLFSSCEDGRRQPTCRLLCKAFLHMIEQVKEVWLVLDALDECRTRKGPLTEGLLSWIREVLNSEQRNVHLLVTSRPEQDIKSEIMKFAHIDDVVPIQSSLITNDIRAYVRTRVNSFERWRSHPKVQNEIETRLMEKADGMFRWAACQLDALENCLNYKMLQNALASLPKTLDETYARILHGIPEEHKQNAIRILQFLTYSEQPLRIEEAVDAIVVDVEADQHFDPKYRMPNPHDILYYCSSLVVLVSAKDHSYNEDDKIVQLQLAHSSIREYLTSNRLDNNIAQNFQEIAAKASIATVCLAYLLHLDVELPTKEIRQRFPLAQYSARYWITYAAVAESKDETLQGFITEFFCCHRSSYRNCYNLYRPDQPWDDEPAKRGEEPASALYYASFGGLINAVKYLLSQGADVNAQGGFYSNALQAASGAGHDKIVELLLSKGADVNAQGGQYGNALQAALGAGHDKIVELLLSKGARSYIV